MSQGQTSYALNSDMAMPGQIADSFSAAEADIVSVACSEDIPFGVVVELSSGKVRRPQGTTTAFVAYGISIRANKTSGDGWKSGEQVAVMRKGRIFAMLVNSGSITPDLKANVYHSSTIATNRGAVTADAESTSAGVEIQDAPGISFVKDISLSGVALVEVNLPQVL